MEARSTNKHCLLSDGLLLELNVTGIFKELVNN